MVTLPPDIVFHRFIWENRSKLRGVYRGKADLDRPLPTQLPAQLLKQVQEMLNSALAHADRDVDTHVEHDPFHFDYIDANPVDALAFCVGGFSFIGTTLPLLDSIWRNAERLSLSNELKQQLPMSLTGEQLKEMSAEQHIQVVLFRIALFFVVLHEFVHVVHGHTAGFIHYESHNIASPGTSRRLDAQIREADADGYAVYFALANLIDSAEHNFIARVLGIDKESVARRDQLLLSLFIASIAAFFFSLPDLSVKASDVYAGDHPTHAARMRLITQAALSWCRQNRIPLKEWLTQQRYNSIMHPVAAAILEGRMADWNTQVDFLHTDEGKEYARHLGEGLDTYVAALPKRKILWYRRLAGRLSRLVRRIAWSSHGWVRKSTIMPSRN